MWTSSSSVVLQRYVMFFDSELRGGHWAVTPSQALSPAFLVYAGEEKGNTT